MELSGTHLEQPIVIDYDESKISTYLITQPIVAESGSNTFTEIVTALKSLTVIRRWLWAAPRKPWSSTVWRSPMPRLSLT